MGGSGNGDVAIAAAAISTSGDDLRELPPSNMRLAAMWLLLLSVSIVAGGKMTDHRFSSQYCSQTPKGEVTLTTRMVAMKMRTKQMTPFKNRWRRLTQQTSARRRRVGDFGLGVVVVVGVGSVGVGEESVVEPFMIEKI